MNHRMILGQNADAAETAALTLADERATERIVEAQDWEHDERMADLMERRRKRRIRDAVQMVLRKMGIKYATVAGAYLRGRKWTDLGVPERTFQHRLKKIKDFFHA